MKVQDKEKAVALRKNGVAMGEIANLLGVAKSSVSYWVRDVVLSKKQQAHLKARSHNAEAIEKRRTARLAHTDKRRAAIRQKAILDIPALTKNPLWYVGVSLYWGEGGKTQRAVRLANSDPDVIKIAMKFFREVCEISEEKFRGHIHTFPAADVKKTTVYWAKVSGIAPERFYKTYVKQSVSSKEIRKTLPNGTFQVYVNDTDFFFTLMTWIEYLKKGNYR